jgi:hypothetical protein
MPGDGRARRFDSIEDVTNPSPKQDIVAASICTFWRELLDD